MTQIIIEKKTKDFNPSGSVIFFIENDKFRINCTISFLKFLENNWNEVLKTKKKQPLVILLNGAITYGMKNDHIKLLMDKIVKDWLGVEYKKTNNYLSLYNSLIYIGLVCLGGADDGKKWTKMIPMILENQIKCPIKRQSMILNSMVSCSYLQ